MIRHIIIIISMTFGLVGCIDTHIISDTPLTSTTHTPTNTITPIPLPLVTIPAKLSPSATVISTPTPLNLGDLPTPIITNITPKLQIICPTQPEVPLEKLGIDSYMFLVTKYDKEKGYQKPEETGALVASLDTLIPKQVPNTISKNGLRLVSYSFSPQDGLLWLSYKSEDNKKESVWLSTWDGKKQWELYEEEYTSPHFNSILIDNRVLFRIYQPDLKEIYEKPISLKNLKTGVTHLFPSFPENLVIKDYFFMKDNFYLIYALGEDLDQFTIYNDANQTSMQAFQWLDDKEWIDFSNTGIYFQENGLFLVRVVRPYGLDLGIDLNLDTVMQSKVYEEVMKAIILPGAEIPVFPGSTSGILLSNGMLIVRYTSFQANITHIYRLDFKDMVLNDYCFETDSGSIAISPDERFIAITTFHFGTVENPGYFVKDVVFLDLKTGFWSKLKDVDYEVIGLYKETPK